MKIGDGPGCLCVSVLCHSTVARRVNDFLAKFSVCALVLVCQFCGMRVQQGLHGGSQQFAVTRMTVAQPSADPHPDKQRMRQQRTNDRDQQKHVIQRHGTSCIAWQPTSLYDPPPPRQSRSSEISFVFHSGPGRPLRTPTSLRVKGHARPRPVVQVTCCQSTINRWRLPSIVSVNHQQHMAG